VTLTFIHDFQSFKLKNVRTNKPVKTKKDLLAQLLALNPQVAAKIERGEPVTAPGVPKNYPDAKKLVTEDCIKPAEITR
jgi:hypothetical protein